MAHVLVVDDSLTIRLTLRSWLEPAGHQVAEAADGGAALAQLAALRGPLVVLLDYQMPGLTGFEVLQQALVERRGPPDYGYVVISARHGDFPPAFTDLLRRLAIQLLPKPFDAQTLLAVVDFVATRLDVAAAMRASAQVDPGPSA
jgi:CheY-like chemotaxis protein